MFPAVVAGTEPACVGAEAGHSTHVDAPSLRIGRSNREHVIVTPSRREFPDAGGNRLTFGFDFDKTDLPEILPGHDTITRTFPVVGSR